MGARARAIEGYTKESELEVLRRLAASMPAEAVVVEVGSFRGRSTVAIAEGLERVDRPRLIAVDTFAGDPAWDEIAEVSEVTNQDTSALEQAIGALNRSADQLTTTIVRPRLYAEG